MQFATCMCISRAMPSPIIAAPIVSAKGLTLHFGTGESAVEVLRGIDLAIMPGETVALLGPSGSGKSSLMAVLSGLERASSGTLSWPATLSGPAQAR